MKLIKIKSIKHLGYEPALNIEMKRNHNFMLENGILTHNTKITQEALRNIMETYASNVFFILTCVEKNSKIYLPSGFKRVQDIKDTEQILTNKNVLENKNTIKRIKNKLIRIKTLHGQEIKVTPEHQFLIQNRWQEANKLKVNDVIDIKLDSLYGKNIELENNKYNIFDETFRTNFKNFLLNEGVFTQEIINDINNNYKKCLLPQHVDLFNKMKENKEYNINDIMLLDNNKCKKHRYNDILGTLKKLGNIELSGDNRNTLYKKVKNIKKEYNFYEMVNYINNKYNTKYNTKQIYNIYRTQTNSKKVHEYFDELNNILNITSLDYQKIEAFGRIMGFMYGDGNIGTGLHFAGNENALKLVRKDMSLLIDFNNSIIKKNGYENGNGWCFTNSSIALVKLFKFLGLPINAKVGQCIHIPKICYKNKLMMKAFIQSLYDCESLRLDIGKNNKTIEQLRFGQKTIISLQGKSTFFEELVNVFKNQFNIESYTKYDYELFDKYKIIKERRMNKTININKQSEILKFMLNIGNYYEEYKIRYDFFGYLLYKNNNKKIINFNEWKEIYYEKNILHDKIISIDIYDGEFEVYDLSLDKEHSYISNGFISHNCNNINKVHDAIISRCVTLQFAYPKKEEIYTYLEGICKAENLVYDVEGLNQLIDLNYPSIRNCVLTLQDLHTQELSVIKSNVKPANNIYFVLWDKLKAGDWKYVKKIVMESTVDPRELNTFFWEQGLKTENIKLIQRTCVNEKDIAVGADAKIIFVTSIIEIAKYLQDGK